jgi:hypothetical protein
VADDADAELLLIQVPADGTTIRNQHLRENLGWSGEIRVSSDAPDLRRQVTHAPGV